jgi:hypothetical protein
VCKGHHQARCESITPPYLVPDSDTTISDDVFLKTFAHNKVETRKGLIMMLGHGNIPEA